MINRTRLAFCGALLLGAVPTQPASAQDYPRLSAAAAGTAITATSVLSNGTAEMNGKLYGGEGQVSWRSLSLRLGYSEGTLGIGSSKPGSTTGNPAEGGVVGDMLHGLFGGGPATPFDLRMVDAHALLGWNAIPGLEIVSGVQGRARYTDDESERLLLWVLRARYEAPIVSHVRGYLEGWNSLAGTATAPQNSVSGRGGSAGVIAEFGPLRARMSYGVDRARYGDGLRRETVQGLGISLGYVAR